MFLIFVHVASIIVHVVVAAALVSVLIGASGACELQGPGMVIVIVIHVVIRLDRHTGCLLSASGGGSTTER